MTILHHPSDTLLAAYANGSLWAGHALVVATHLEFCEACAVQVRGWERLGGAFLDSLPPAAMGDDALARTLAKLDVQESPAPLAPPQARFESIVLPRAVAAQGVGRKQLRTRAIWTADVVTDKTGARAFLLGVKAGGSIPHHRHRGMEVTCVLDGSFSDAHGTYAKGDFTQIEGDSDHAPAVMGAADCICIVSADGAPRFRLLRWIAQTLAGSH